MDAENYEKIIGMIEEGLNDSDWCVREEAMRACAGLEVPAEIIEKGMDDSNWRVREATMRACAGKEVPICIIRRGLNDSSLWVRGAAMIAYMKNKIGGIKNESN